MFADVTRPEVPGMKFMAVLPPVAPGTKLMEPLPVLGPADPGMKFIVPTGTEIGPGENVRSKKANRLEREIQTKAYALLTRLQLPDTNTICFCPSCYLCQFFGIFPEKPFSF